MKKILFIWINKQNLSTTNKDTFLILSLLLSFSFLSHSPINWACRICWLHLCRGLRLPPDKFPGYDTKQFDGEATVLAFGECGLPLHCHYFPGPLWPGVVVLVRVLSMSQIVICNFLNLKSFNCGQINYWC